MMKVAGINNILFKSSSIDKDRTSTSAENNYKTNELNNITPDFNIKVPQKYTKISIDSLPNNLKLHSYRLANGYRVSIIPMEESPAIVKTYVNVGAMNETPDIKGISHFLEHMAFNGTNGENGHLKLETGDSFKKIDALGGWSNASTNYALTDYINSSPLLDNRDIETQIKVLASMTEDLKLSDEMIEKEKGPVSSEINMIMDDPQTIAMDQTVRTLYNIKNPADELVGGSIKHIQNLTRKDVMDYYNHYYTPENINIVVTGDVDPDEVIQIISKNFISNKKNNGKRFDEKLTPIQKTVRKDFVSDKATSAEIVMGFNGYKNNSMKEQILYCVAQAYLASETVGISKSLKKYNADFGFGGEKITNNPNGNRLNYINASSSDENVENVIKTIYKTIKSAPPISEEELIRIKDSFKESRELNFEYSGSVNSIIGQAVQDGTIQDYLNYEKIIDEISPQEVDEAVKKYFDFDKTAITVIHPKNKSELSFKGNSRKLPINENKISQTGLENNIELGFYETKSPTRCIDINFCMDMPCKTKAGVKEILDEIYSMGTMKLCEDEYNKLKEKLNLSVLTNADFGGICITVDGNSKNYQSGLNIAKDLIYSPRLTEETLQKAKDRVRENIERTDISAGRLYINNFYSKYDEFAFSDKEILNSLDKITLDDIKEFHKYIIDNSRCIISANIPEKECQEKSDILKFAESLKTVKPNTIHKRNIYKNIESPIVLTQISNNSQADIKQVYNFKTEDNLKSRITGNLMNSILTNSSIGLFDTLREKEHLAYSVFSDVYRLGNDLGEVSLNILTTTDNKDIGEISYDNLQKSINGFKCQINELINGNFTEDDLENAKRSYKAKLLDKEGAHTKTYTLSSSLDSKYGLTMENQLYETVDSISKDDIVSFAKNAFAGNPVYAITATEDTLNANKEYLESLKNNPFSC